MHRIGYDEAHPHVTPAARPAPPPVRQPRTAPALVSGANLSPAVVATAWSRAAAKVRAQREAVAEDLRAKDGRDVLQEWDTAFTGAAYASHEWTEAGGGELTVRLAVTYPTTGGLALVMHGRALDAAMLAELHCRVTVELATVEAQAAA